VTRQQLKSGRQKRHPPEAIGFFNWSFEKGGRMAEQTLKRNR
jgi:hypothetical protein